LSSLLDEEVPVDDPGRERADAAITARALVRSFTGGVEAVRGIDLTVGAGEVFGFLGPNGAGKTTTVRMLCTLLPPTAGRATVAGLDVEQQADEVRRRIGVALQEIGLDPVQTGRELLELHCGLYGITGRRARERTEELLTLVGLTDAADRRTKTYSGGMKRRLDLASALVHAPEVLFLDEPTNGLDPASRLTIWEEVRRINREGATVFLTTQYLEEADKLCDRLAIIDGGRIVAEGTPGQLKAEMGHDVVSVGLERADLAAAERALDGLPGLERIVTEEHALALYVADGAGSLAEIVRRFERQEIRVGAIRVAQPTLDDVFLQATGRRIEGQDQAAAEEASTP
jgi:ABC-2 type transport system ATP-binding protein